ncbi:MAG: hypothetical protein P8166_00270 [Candidatus Thiodiazotropha sp.]
MNHRQLIRGLVKLCKEKASGTLFFHHGDGESARFVLSRGRDIEMARTSFNPALKLVIGKQYLPSTTEIIKQLSRRGNDHSASAVPTVTEVVSMIYPGEDADPDSQFDLHPAGDTDIPDIEEFSERDAKAVDSGARFSQGQVHLVLEMESMEYLGPMAKILCEDYMKSMPPQLDHTHVRQLINSFVRDINDDLKGRLFMERVKRSLNIL